MRESWIGYNQESPVRYQEVVEAIDQFEKELKNLDMKVSGLTPPGT